ncbi:MAG TPA: hypothetical protein VJ723_11180 [Candidatus Angelobacter sp.]|nr:hypothetical protein [Candidatus Angelobacter sp.]
MKKKAAIGIRAHSGWGALVAVSGEIGTEEIIERERIVIVDTKAPGVKQPYHFAQMLSARESETAAEQHVKKCAAASSRMARAAVSNIVKRLQDRGYRVVGAAILLGSGRSLPPFAKILASHPMLHTAEGVFFRQALCEACEHLAIPVTGIPERQLEDHAGEAFGRRTASIQRRIAAMGRSVGPPWTLDQKSAALGAAIVLAASRH